MGRTAFVDYGLKRIGLAISSEVGGIALPLKMIQAGKNLQESVANVLKALSSYAIDLVLVGLPLLMKGTKGEMAVAAEAFALALQQATKAKVECMDERLSSKQAERSLMEMDFSRKERTKFVDSTAAALLLQTYLNRVL